MNRSDLEHILRASKGVTGWCLEPHHLAYSKLAAGRQKDLELVANLLRYNLVRLSRVQRLIESSVDEKVRDRLAGALESCRSRSHA